MTFPYQICVFEDAIAESFSPYQLTRPVYTITHGMYHLVEKLARITKDVPITLLCQSNHEVFLRKRFPKLAINILNKSLPTLFINGRSTLSANQFNAIVSGITPDKNHVFIHNKQIPALYCVDNLQASVFNLLLNRPTADDIILQTRQKSIVKDLKSAHMITNWWDILTDLGSQLARDYEWYSKRSLIEGTVSSFTQLTNDHDIAISSTAIIGEYVSLDATNGPIVIQDYAVIKPFVRIEGPCFIGAHTIIQSHADIGGSSIGRHCKVGGECKGSVMHDYSNKNHYGYVGDSVIGEWVNLGAGTTTSNLKVSYGTIRSSNGPSPLISTNRQFLGSLIGDFVKTAIQTSLTSGSVIGSATTLLGHSPHPVYIPPLTWGKKNDYRHQDIPSFLTALTRMMTRRNHQLSNDESAVLTKLFKAITHQPTTHS